MNLSNILIAVKWAWLEQALIILYWDNNEADNRSIGEFKCRQSFCK